MKKICVIGLGYIGLPTAAMFASHGHRVLGVDLNSEVIDSLKNGEITIEEPGLDKLVRKTVSDGSLRGGNKPEESDAFIICVPTPITEDKKADMRYVKSAAESIVPYLSKGCIIVLESTSPPKTVERLLCPILEGAGLKPGEDVYLAHSPERVLPGNILYELENNDRVVGGINRKSAEAVGDLYKSFVKGNIYLTDATTAEMCKLMENTYRDVNIAFANEAAKISETLGVNVWEVIELANKHPRVNILQPGPGVGGHCIAVDPWFIVEKAVEISPMIRLSRSINDGMPLYTAQKCETVLGGINGKKILMLGATYKPDVDDMRESPVIKVVEALIEKQGEVIVCDPHVKLYKAGFDRIYGHAKGASLIVLGVNHKEFHGLDFSRIATAMETPNIIDTRNCLNAIELKRLGFNYFLLGAY